MIQKALKYLQGEGLAARARRGSLLTIFKIGGNTLMRLISNLILTKLLFPEAFGLMALVQVVQAGTAVFSNLGIRASVIQHERGNDPIFLNAAWTLQIIRGFVLYLMVVLAAPYAAAFYDEPLLAALLYVTGLSAVIKGFTPARAHVANRNLQLGRLTILALVAQAVTIVVTVTLAWILQSVWALAIGTLVGGTVNILLIYLFLPGVRDRLCFEWAAMRDLISFGVFVLISSAATFVITNGDRAVLGKFVEIDMLGIYAIAMTLATLPLLVARNLANRIVFPLYSRRPPQESAQNRKNLSRARLILTTALFGASLVLILVGDPLVRFLYDARYDLAGGITVLVALGLLPMLLMINYDSILLSNGRSDLHAVLTVSNGVLRLVALYVGISTYGIVGAALAPAVSSLLHYPLMVLMIRPYKAWDPRHDALFFAVTAAFIALCWWINADAIRLVPGFPEGF